MTERRTRLEVAGTLSDLETRAWTEIDARIRERMYPVMIAGVAVGIALGVVLTVVIDHARRK